MNDYWPWRVCALTLGLALVGLGCSSDPEVSTSANDAPTTIEIPPDTITPETTTPDTTTPDTTVSAETTTAPETTTITAEPSAVEVVVDIVVVDGSVAGGAQRVKVPLGDPVIVRLTADVDDEMHVHGYDLFADVSPVAAAEVRFNADIPGVFEVELEGAGLELVRLEVS